MKKQEAEDLLKITIYALKKWGYLEGENRCGLLMWTHGGNREKSSVQIETISLAEQQHIKIIYTLTRDKTSLEREHLIPLVTSECYFGGERYWFLCMCKRRVGVLYGDGNSFLCRHCHNLSYESKNRNTRSSFNELGKALRIREKIKTLNKELKRPVYNGEPTKKWRKLEKLRKELRNQNRLVSNLFKDIL